MKKILTTIIIMVMWCTGVHAQTTNFSLEDSVKNLADELISKLDTLLKTSKKDNLLKDTFNGYIEVGLSKLYVSIHKYQDWASYHISEKTSENELNILTYMQNGIMLTYKEPSGLYIYENILTKSNEKLVSVRGTDAYHPRELSDTDANLKIRERSRFWFKIFDF